MTNNKKKVAIITLHRVFNYGSLCQTYATQRIFEKLGYDVEVIDYITEQRSNKRLFLDVSKGKYKSVLKKYVYILFRAFSILIKKYTFGRFFKKHIKLSAQKYISSLDLEKNPPVADIYVAGSDQIWNSTYNEGIDKGFCLDFVKSNRKISFASSFGKTELDEFEEKEMKKCLCNFKAISVREKQAVDILKKMGFESKCVLDPTLQLNKEEWLVLASKRLIKNKYLLLFLLYNEDNGATEYARKLADKKGLTLVKLSWELKKNPLIDRLMTHRTPEDFLSLFQYADVIVTNSFHGLAFSINLNKEFIIFPRNEFNSRIESLLDIVGLSERMIRNDNIKFDFSPIDYKVVNQAIKEERAETQLFLKEALNE